MALRGGLSSAFHAAALAALFSAAASPALAQATLSPLVQGPAEAIAEDAAEYARQNGVSVEQATRRLRAQEESVAATDRLREIHRERLAGISVEHRPDDFRIVLLLTGSDPVPDRTIFAGGMKVPVVFRTGAAATAEQVAAAMAQHQAAIRGLYPQAQGMGLDERTGELVLLLRTGDDLDRLVEMEAELQELTGVPARVVLLDRPDTNFGIEGGARVEGIDPANGRRYACTTGFVVTDSTRTGVVTAAHCPDTLTYLDSNGGGKIPLDFVGQWGARHQDVQVHVSDRAQRPLFYANAAKSAARLLTGQRSRTSTRAGDAVCHRGETTGYSCSKIELTHYAPPGDLCGGPCSPTWVTVTGPSCRAGDSGGPIFNGSIAFGIAKGGNYGRGGRCNFYYYMSTDYLPDGWSLLFADRRRSADGASYPAQ